MTEENKGSLDAKNEKHKKSMEKQGNLFCF
jgi:hypothetical protein